MNDEPAPAPASTSTGTSWARSSCDAVGGDRDAVLALLQLTGNADDEGHALILARVARRLTGDTAPSTFLVVTGTADVLIIGAGASGGVAARRLAEAGFSVVCLEQGDWPDRAEYPGRHARVGSERSASSGRRRRTCVRRRRDYPIDGAHCDLGIGNFNGVGGGTVLYNAVWPRLLPVRLPHPLARRAWVTTGR